MRNIPKLIAALSVMALIPAALPAVTLVAGWDAFNSTLTPTATETSTDTTATLATSGTGGNWDDWNGGGLAGASSDGTFGNLSSAVAAASTNVGTGSNQGTNLSLNRSRKPGTITITLTNDSTEDRLMGGFYFDAVGRFSQSAKDWNLTFSGAISGTAANGTLAQNNMMGATAAQRDWEVNLATLTDSVWEAGTDAIFTLTFSGGATSTGSGGGQETLVDNIGITILPAPTDVVKADNTDDLNLGTSWVGGTAPASGDSAKWDSTVAGANTTVLGADATWGNIIVENPGGLVTIGAGNTLTLDAGGIAVDLSAATADLVLNNNLVFQGSDSFTVDTGRTVTAAGVISGSSGLNKQGAGAVILSAANTYTGDTNVTEGTLQLGASDVIPFGGGGGASGNVTVDGTLDLNTFSQSLNGLNGSVAGVIDTVAGGTPTLTVGFNGQPSTFNGTIQNTSGTLNLTKDGVNTLTLGGANTYSGATTVLGGTLQVTSLGALGSTSEVSLANGTEFVPDLDLFTTSAPFTIDTSATISVPINGPGGGGAITMTLNGAISGNGDLIFTDLGDFGNNSDGTIVLGAASDYTGDTLIDTSGLQGANVIIRSGATNALPTTTVLTLDGGLGIGSGRVVSFDLNGNDQTLAGLQNVPQLERKQFVTSSGAATLTVSNVDDSAFGESGAGDGIAQIQGAISLVKSGAGTFTLSETQPYTGITTISAGKLQGVTGGGIASSAVTLSAGTYGVSITDNSLSWTSDSLTTSGAGTLEFDFGSVTASASVSPMIITNAADFSAATPLVSVLVDVGLPVGTYPLATWGSLVGTAPATAELTVSNLAPSTVAELSVSGSTLNLEIVSTAVDVTKLDNADDLNLGSSWSGGTAPAAFDTAVWDSAVTGANTASLGADLAWGAIRITDPGGPVTINGANTLTLNGDGTGFMTTIDMSVATQDLTINTDLILNDGGFWDVAAGQTLTITGAISGNFGFFKDGAGTAILSGANSYTGTTNVDNGTLQLGADDVIPNGPGNGNVVLLGTLDLNGFSDTVNGLTGFSFGVVDNTAGSTTSTLTVGDDDFSGSFSGTLQNSGTSAILNLAKIGSGTLTLTGTNTFSGTTTVSGGTLEIGSASALGITSGISLSGGTNLIPTLDGVTISAPITLSDAATTSTINAPSSGGGGDIETLTLDSVIDGDGDLRLFGSAGSNTRGTIVLGAQSTYAGNTTFDTAGGGNVGQQLFVELGTTNALPVTTVLTLDGGVGAGTGRTLRFDLKGFDQTLAGLTNISGFAQRRQEIQNSGALATLTIDNADDYTFGESVGTGTYAEISGAISLVKSGVGIFTLAEVHNYTGDTTVNAGILSLGGINPSNESSTVTIADTGATLDLDFVGTDTVDQLFIGGTQLAAGEYGPSATDIPQITGTGTLTVTSGPAGFASWASTNGAAGGFDDDHDNDGVKNGVEFFIGGPSGNTTGQTDLPSVVDDAGTLSVTWTKASDYPGVYGTDYWVETSATLSAPWAQQAADPDSGFTVTFPSATEVKFTFPAGTKDFARLQVPNPE